MSADSILITGATGQQGSAATRALLEAGSRVRILTRDPATAKAAALADAGAEIIVGDLADRGSLEAAMTNIAGVFCVAPMVGSFKPPTTFSYQVSCIKNVIDAAERAHVSRFVLSSASGADKSVNENRSAKLLMESYLRSRIPRYTILRPVSFMDNFALPRWGLHQGLFTTALLPTVRQQMIAAHDVGMLAARVFERPSQTVGRTIEIAGDDLSPIQMAQTLSAALRRHIPCLQISSDLLSQINPVLGSGFASLNAGHRAEIDIDSLRELHPGLMRFETWLSAIGAKRLHALLPTVTGGMLDERAHWHLTDGAFNGSAPG